MTTQTKEMIEMTATLQQLEENMKKAMNTVQDDICLFYDQAYTDAECLKFIHESLVAARKARDEYFERQLQLETLE